MDRAPKNQVTKRRNGWTLRRSGKTRQLRLTRNGVRDPQTGRRHKDLDSALRDLTGESRFRKRSR